MATKNAPQPQQQAQGAPGSNRTPSPADIYMRWLSRVQETLRKAFHSDQRIGEDALCKAQAKAIRQEMEIAQPKDRFAILVRAVRTHTVTPEEEAIAKDLTVRRLKVRDHLTTVAGMRPGEGWDDLYYRTCESRRMMDALGRELHSLGAMKGDLPEWSPYRQAARGRVMDSEPSEREDAFA